MNLMINYSSKWWYKLITILLILALILYLSFGIAPKASAVVVSTVIVGSVLAAMAAAGVGLAVSGMTSEELTQWVSDKLNDWTADIGGSVQDHINGNLITVTANGILSIGSAAAQGISDFISWLQTEDSLTDDSTITEIAGSVTINGLNVVKLPTQEIEINSWFYSYYPYNVGDTVYLYNKLNSGFVFFTYDTNITTVRQKLRRSNGTISYSDIGMNVVESGFRFNRGSYTGDGTALNAVYPGTTHNGEPPGLFGNAEPIESGLDYITGTITIPTIEENEKWYIDVGADAGEDVDTVTDGVITDTLTNTLEVSDEIVESNAQEVVIVNEDAIEVNVDHHMIGFSNLPDFAHLNLNSIWHYVSDAVDYASSWLSWFVSFLSAMPLLAIPLYMSFTLLVVLSFLRRFI